VPVLFPQITINICKEPSKFLDPLTDCASFSRHNDSDDCGHIQAKTVKRPKRFKEVSIEWSC
jgi:hypothetical protein